ncbi:hypothetical protein B0T21DRAFT_37824 [Apiosordaria backusii]|uniref:Protein kinase domain-containing protein n=1 Tax=Apiosordaria backusii TaxID=314023 RepID=A0AA40E6A4_9PEZI|nr:hypothetical protein B0T21DRAFT_37824 [Apiosordaria backusii]
MSDATAIAAALTGLFPLVKEVFLMTQVLFEADKKLRSFWARVELQRAIFDAWEDGWLDARDKPDDKIRAYAFEKPLLARGILKEFVSLLKTLSDPDKLKKRYGLRPDRIPKYATRNDDVPRDLRYYSDYLNTVDSRFNIKGLPVFNKSITDHLNLLKTVRYVIVGEDYELEDVVIRFGEFNRDLQLYTASEANNEAAQRIYEVALRGLHSKPDDPARLAEAALFEQKATIDPDAKSFYGDLAKFIGFSLSLRDITVLNGRGLSPNMPSQKIFSRRDFSFDAPYKLSSNSTLARLLDYPTKYQTRLVLVEWIPVPKTVNVKTKLEDLKSEWYVLHADKPDGLLLPTAQGLVYDSTDPNFIGIVFQLPSHIRTELPPKVAGRIDPRIVRSPKTTASQRMPTSLRQLILREQALDLGIRFKIAQKLLNSLHLMHTAGWMHKKIRADNILFFPSQDRDGEPDPSRLDFDTPFLAGFHSARLEIEVSSALEVAAKPLEHIRPLQGLGKVLNAPRVIALDAYQHPEYRYNVNLPYRNQYDLYGAGAVLLELGLWETLECVEKGDIGKRGYDPRVVPTKEDIRKDGETVERAAGYKLDRIMGSTYAKVVRECLTLKPLQGDLLPLERALVARLANCQA